MGHYSKVVDGLVVEVIVADIEFINTLDNPNQWVKTSYNTRKNTHILGGTPLRKNYGAIGYTYSTTLDAFIEPKPYNSWVLDTTTGTYEPPVARPDTENSYEWNETNQEWVIDND